DEPCQAPGGGQHQPQLGERQPAQPRHPAEQVLALAAGPGTPHAEAHLGGVVGPEIPAQVGGGPQHEHRGAGERDEITTGGGLAHEPSPSAATNSARRASRSTDASRTRTTSPAAASISTHAVTGGSMSCTSTRVGEPDPFSGSLSSLRSMTVA